MINSLQVSSRLLIDLSFDKFCLTFVLVKKDFIPLK